MIRLLVFSLSPLRRNVNHHCSVVLLHNTENSDVGLFVLFDIVFLGFTALSGELNDKIPVTIVVLFRGPRKTQGFGKCDDKLAVVGVQLRA